jgi:GlpG protein
MRLIGIAEKREATSRFIDYLLTQGIRAEAREQPAGWAVWVYDEDQVATAEREFGEYQRAPQEARYNVASEAHAIRQKAQAAEAKAPVRAVELPPAATGPVTWRSIPVTSILIALTLTVAVVSKMGLKPVLQQWLAFSPAAWQGQFWRLVTPVFLHFGVLHLVFNLLWFWELGGSIEVLKGRRMLLRLVLVIAAISNLIQYVASGPDVLFGGLSGVVYGLFGYIWVKSRREPASGFMLDQVTVVLMLGWFVIGATGWVGPVANWVHGSGLAAGVLAGFVPSRRRR